MKNEAKEFFKVCLRIFMGLLLYLGGIVCAVLLLFHIFSINGDSIIDALFVFAHIMGIIVFLDVAMIGHILCDFLGNVNFNVFM